MSNRTSAPFAIVPLLLLLLGGSLTAAASYWGGKAWLAFGCLATFAAAALALGWNWAMRGAGSWPRGIKGWASTCACLIALPILIAALFTVGMRAMENQQIWWNWFPK